jgi:ubiquinone/menaquinone biosynthesis C-methylase UbiE
MTADPAFWDGIAEKYAAQPVEDPAAFERKIAITKGLMRPESVIADVGCGTGSLALILAPHAAEVHGLDVSGEMVRIARGKAEAQGATNVRFHQGGLDAPLPFEAESLDGLCAYSILHLVHDLPGRLRRLHGAIKPGGFFVSSTVCMGDTWVPLGALVRVMRLFGKAPYVASFDRGHLAEEVAAAGFVDVAFHDVGAKDTIAFLTARRPG